MRTRPAHRWLIALAVPLLSGAGCAGTGPASWQEPGRYEFTVQSSCGERSLIGRFTLTVHDGVVTRAVGLDEAGSRAVGTTDLAELPTLKDLLDEYEAARREGAYVAVAEYDPVDGHPTRIELDPERNTIDEESCYLISGYRELS